MNLFDFIRWCFQSTNSTIGTLSVAYLLFQGVESLIKAWRSPK